MTPEVQLKTSLHDGVWSARCDAKQLANALPNLTVNAPDPMPDGGMLTGLGLSQVYGFVRQSGGFASLESKVGRGTDCALLFRQNLLDTIATGPIHGYAWTAQPLALLGGARRPRRTDGDSHIPKRIGGVGAFLEAAAVRFQFSS